MKESGENITRKVALHMQRGILDAREWVYGPITFCRVEYPMGIAASVQLKLGAFCLQLSVSQAFPEIRS